MAIISVRKFAGFCNFFNQFMLRGSKYAYIVLKGVIYQFFRVFIYSTPHERFNCEPNIIQEKKIPLNASLKNPTTKTSAAEFRLRNPNRYWSLQLKSFCTFSFPPPTIVLAPTTLFTCTCLHVLNQRGPTSVAFRRKKNPARNYKLRRRNGPERRSRENERCFRSYGPRRRGRRRRFALERIHLQDRVKRTVHQQELTVCSWFIYGNDLGYTVCCTRARRVVTGSRIYFADVTVCLASQVFSERLPFIFILFIINIAYIYIFFFCLYPLNFYDLDRSECIRANS